jgi:hypothetical protein
MLHGNVSATSGIQTITVNDTEKQPCRLRSASLLENDPNECFATVNPGLATASDNCPGATVNGVRSDAMAVKCSLSGWYYHDRLDGYRRARQYNPPPRRSKRSR